MVAVLLGWGVAQWPYLLPESLKVTAGAAPDATLWSVLIVFVVAGIVILAASALVNEYATRKPLLRANEKMVDVMLHADLLGRHSEAIQAMGMGQTVIARWKEQNEQGLVLQDKAQDQHQEGFQGPSTNKMIRP